MKNVEIAEILRNISLYLEMEEEQVFKIRAYDKAARSIEALDKQLSDIYKEGGIDALMDIPGIGQSIAEKIEEMLKTGKLKYYEQLKKKAPVDIEELALIEGVGPKTIKILYKKLHVRSVSDLEKVARAGKIKNLRGFGEKSEQDILKGIEFLKRSSGRFVLGYVLPLITDI
jgi:DNA polymerase (family 10)